MCRHGPRFHQTTLPCVAFYVPEGVKQSRAGSRCSSETDICLKDGNGRTISIFSVPLGFLVHSQLAEAGCIIERWLKSRKIEST